MIILIIKNNNTNEVERHTMTQQEFNNQLSGFQEAQDRGMIKLLGMGGIIHGTNKI